MTAAARSVRVRRRGVSLIEAVICVVVLALAVPPCLELLSASAAQRADAVNTTRAACFAELILETCLADSVSDASGLGYGALDDADAYRASIESRLGVIAEPYADVGMSYELVIGDPVDRFTQVNPNSDENIFRLITITIRYPSARGPELSMPVSMLVGDL